MSGGPGSQLSAAFISHPLDTGELQDHIASVLQPAYALRYQTVVVVINKYLEPLNVSFRESNGVAGGYYV